MEPVVDRAVVFDLDGTLVDSRVAVVDAVSAGIEEVARRHGHDPVRVDPRVLRDALGLPARTYFETVLPATLRDLAIEVKEAATAHEVAALAAGEGRLFPGVLDGLTRLADRGYALAVVSNAQRPYFRAALEHLGLDGLLAHAECHEELPADAVSPYKRILLARALQALRCPPARTWMVGDREADVEAGRRLGCRTIGVLYGFGSAGELGAAEHRVDDFDSLVDRVLRPDGASGPR